MATVSVVLTMGGRDDQRVSTGPGPADVSEDAHGRALTLAYVPPGFGLAEDVEHRRPLGDRLRTMRWVRDDHGQRQAFEVHRRVGNALDIAAELRLGPAAQEAKVQGQPAVLVREGPFMSLSWLTHKDVTLSIASKDLPEPELRRVADGIVYRPEHDALSLPDDIHPVDPGDGNRQLEPETVVAQGEVEGMAWELVAYPSDSGLCVDLRFWRGAGGGCGHDIGPHRAVNLGISSTLGGFRFAHGVTRTDVAAVRLKFGNGDILDLSTSKLVSFDVNFVATPLPADTVIEAVVALDGQGRVLQELPGLELQ